jgi:hypothetical protein
VREEEEEAVGYEDGELGLDVDHLGLERERQLVQHEEAHSVAQVEAKRDERNDLDTHEESHIEEQRADTDRGGRTGAVVLRVRQAGEERMEENVDERDNALDVLDEDEVLGLGEDAQRLVRLLGEQEATASSSATAAGS